MKTEPLDALFGADADDILREYSEGARAHRAVLTRSIQYADVVEPRVFTPRSEVGRQLALAGLPSFGKPQSAIEEEAYRTLVEALIRALGIRMYGQKLKRRQAELKLLEELVWWCTDRGRSLDGVKGIEAMQRLVVGQSALELRHDAEP